MTGATGGSIGRQDWNDCTGTVVVFDRMDVWQRGVSLEFLDLYSSYVQENSDSTNLNANTLVHGPRAEYIEKDGYLVYMTKPSRWAIRGITESELVCLVDWVRERLRNEEFDHPLMQKLRGRKEEDLFGAPKFFVSHAWQLAWRDLLEAVKIRVAGDRDAKVWVDIFAINQHSVSPLEGDDIKRLRDICKSELLEMPHVIRKTTDGLLLIYEPWEDPIALKRAWVWNEIAASLHFAKSIQICLTEENWKNLGSALESIDPVKDTTTSNTKSTNQQDESPETNNIAEQIATTSKEFFQTVTKIDAASSECSIASDQKRIHLILKSFGGLGCFTEANRRMRIAVGELLWETAKTRVGTYNSRLEPLLKELETIFGDKTQPTYDAFHHGKLLIRMASQFKSSGSDEALEWAKRGIDLLRKSVQHRFNGGGLKPERKRDMLLELCQSYTVLMAIQATSSKPAYMDITEALKSGTEAIEVLHMARMCEDPFEKMHDGGRDATLDPTLANVHFLMGRVLVLHHEFAKDKIFSSSRDQKADMQTAETHLHECLELVKVPLKIVDQLHRETCERSTSWDSLDNNARAKFALIAQTLIMLGKIMDINPLASNRAESDWCFEIGRQLLPIGLGPTDSRVEFYTMSRGYHFFIRGDYEQAIEIYGSQDLHSKLERLVRNREAPVYKYFDLLSCFLKSLEKVSTPDTQQMIIETVEKMQAHLTWLLQHDNHKKNVKQRMIEEVSERVKKIREIHPRSPIVEKWPSETVWKLPTLG